MVFAVGDFVVGGKDSENSLQFSPDVLADRSIVLLGPRLRQVQCLLVPPNRRVVRVLEECLSNVLVIFFLSTEELENTFVADHKRT